MLFTLLAFPLCKLITSVVPPPYPPPHPTFMEPRGQNPLLRKSCRSNPFIHSTQPYLHRQVSLSTRSYACNSSIFGTSLLLHRRSPLRTEAAPTAMSLTLAAAIRRFVTRHLFGCRSKPVTKHLRHHFHSHRFRTIQSPFSVQTPPPICTPVRSPHRAACPSGS